MVLLFYPTDIIDSKDGDVFELLVILLSVFCLRSFMFSVRLRVLRLLNVRPLLLSLRSLNSLLRLLPVLLMLLNLRPLLIFLLSLMS